MQTFEHDLKTMAVKIDLDALPDDAQRELVEFYEFLVFKYQRKPDVPQNEKRTILTTIFKETDGKLPLNYRFNREEIHER
jgi:hypothetical protein